MSDALDRAVTRHTCSRGLPVRAVLFDGGELIGTLRSFGAQRLTLITDPPTGASGVRTLYVHTLRGVYQERHEMVVPQGLPKPRSAMDQVRVAVVDGVVELYQWIDAEGRESDGAYLSYDYVKGRAAELGGEVKVLRFEFADSEPLDDFREDVTG